MKITTNQDVLKTIGTWPDILWKNMSRIEIIDFVTGVLKDKSYLSNLAAEVLHAWEVDTDLRHDIPKILQRG